MQHNSLYNHETIAEYGLRFSARSGHEHDTVKFSNQSVGSCSTHHQHLELFKCYLSCADFMSL